MNLELTHVLKLAGWQHLDHPVYLPKGGITEGLILTWILGSEGPNSGLFACTLYIERYLLRGVPSI